MCSMVFGCFWELWIVLSVAVGKHYLKHGQINSKTSSDITYIIYRSLLTELDHLPSQSVSTSVKKFTANPWVISIIRHLDLLVRCVGKILILDLLNHLWPQFKDRLCKRIATATYNFSQPKLACTAKPRQTASFLDRELIWVFAETTETWW